MLAGQLLVGKACEIYLASADKEDGRPARRLHLLQYGRPETTLASLSLSSCLSLSVYQ